MQLDSASFFAFLLVVWLVWRLLPAGPGKRLLLLASLAFYAASSPAHAGMIAMLLALNHAAARRLTNLPDQWPRSALFGFIVLVDVGVLVFFKWAAVAWAPSLGTSAGFHSWVCIPAGRLAFPLGLSFIIFQMIACVTDVCRRQFEWRGGLGEFLLFGFFFPQVSAGPIPRASTLMPQLLAPKNIRWADFNEAVVLVLSGLVKKFVVANRLDIFVGQIFSSDLPLSSLPLALGFLFNAIQLYADFSGYTDIARGIARLFGVTLGENFDHPFLAESVTDFWRRWHISLSTWLKDYLYLPVVLRLRSWGRSGIVVSFLLTFLVCGLWHKATWAFALFGLLHGTALAVEFLTKQIRKRLFRHWPENLLAGLARFYAIGFFVLTMVLFRASSLKQALALYSGLIHCTLPASVGEMFAYSGPVLFALNFVALAAWFGLSRLKKLPVFGEAPASVLACGLAILLIGKLPEGNFIYVQF